MTRALLVLVLALPLAGCLEFTTAPQPVEITIQEPARRDSVIVCDRIVVAGVISICCHAPTVTNPTCGIPQ